eukprot:gene5922-6520_t
MTLSNLLIEPNEDGLEEAASLLRNGRLLAFPTETVYGLGANALNVEAVLDIFRAKGRPLTDPLIVHIAKSEDAYELLDVSPVVKEVFTILANQFWPGPLTIIAKASQLIPLPVTANTGFVGIRCPKHPLARLLIEKAGVPVAAPSANRFGHVSPTRAKHVLDDLAEKGVKVLNGESGLVSYDSASCEFGIESTVIKLNAETSEVWIYRQGAISQRQLEECLQQHQLAWKVIVVKRTVNMDEEAVENVDEVKAGEEAPGQAITHYAPDVPCYLVQSLYLNKDVEVSSPSYEPLLGRLTLSVDLLAAGVVMLDFGGRFSSLGSNFLAYRDLSPSHNYLEAAQNLFDSLRWTEQIIGVRVVLIANTLDDKIALPPSTENGDQSALDLCHGLADRIFRATSGRNVDLVVVNMMDKV